MRNREKWLEALQKLAVGGLWGFIGKKRKEGSDDLYEKVSNWLHLKPSYFLITTEYILSLRRYWNRGEISPIVINHGSTTA